MATRSLKHPGRKNSRSGQGSRVAGRRATRLTPDAVVEEAVAVLGRDGLDGLSLRRLATRLHISAPSLYTHVPDKATLLGAVLEQLFCDCVRRVGRHQHWQDWMKEFATLLWDKQESIKDFGRLLMSAPMNEIQMQRVETLLRSRLASLDIPVAEAMRIQGSVQVLLTGWFIFAHSPFSPTLSSRMNFHKRAMHDLELILEGEQRHQPAPRG